MRIGMVIEKNNSVNNCIKTDNRNIKLKNH